MFKERLVAESFGGRHPVPTESQCANRYAAAVILDLIVDIFDSLFALDLDRPVQLRKHTSHKAHQGVPQPQDRSGHGLQADDVGAEKMAQARRSKSPARDHPGD